MNGISYVNSASNQVCFKGSNKSNRTSNYNIDEKSNDLFTENQSLKQNKADKKKSNSTVKKIIYNIMSTFGLTPKESKKVSEKPLNNEVKKTIPEILTKEPEYDMKQFKNINSKSDGCYSGFEAFLNNPFANANYKNEPKTGFDDTAKGYNTKLGNPLEYSVQRAETEIKSTKVQSPVQTIEKLRKLAEQKNKIREIIKKSVTPDASLKTIILDDNETISQSDKEIIYKNGEKSLSIGLKSDKQGSENLHIAYYNENKDSALGIIRNNKNIIYKVFVKDSISTLMDLKQMSNSALEIAKGAFKSNFNYEKAGKMINNFIK